MNKKTVPASLPPHLLIFGAGYSALPFGAQMVVRGWRVSATIRAGTPPQKLVDAGIAPLIFGESSLPTDISHIVVSVPPNAKGNHTEGAIDAVLATYGAAIRALTGLKWIAYLSSTNVYGDHGGQWVTETTKPAPTLARGIRRLAAEAAWQKLAHRCGAALYILRLAGIYGPGRNAVRSLLDGTARRIIKKGQVFSRIHRDDICRALSLAATADPIGPGPCHIFNLADDTPCPPQDIVAAAAKLLNMPAPPPIAFELADISPMAKSFYSENKRVKNTKIKTELGLELMYPGYMSALRDLVKYELA